MHKRTVSLHLICLRRLGIKTGHEPEQVDSEVKWCVLCGDSHSKTHRGRRTSFECKLCPVRLCITSSIDASGTKDSCFNIWHKQVNLQHRQIANASAVAEPMELDQTPVETENADDLMDSAQSVRRLRRRSITA